VQEKKKYLRWLLPERCNERVKKNADHFLYELDFPFFDIPRQDEQRPQCLAVGLHEQNYTRSFSESFKTRMKNVSFPEAIHLPRCN
jgi:hypothetical protein